MRQRCTLISAYENLALEAETVAWTVVADLLMESLRLKLEDNMGMRFCFPIALLRANRDDDAVLLLPVLDIEK
jgi:hypothetical protein